MSDYDHVAAIYDFAKQHGYKVRSFSTLDRGYNHNVKVNFVIPPKDKLDDYLMEIDNNVHSGESAEAQKE